MTTPDKPENPARISANDGMWMFGIVLGTSLLAYSIFSGDYDIRRNVVPAVMLICGCLRLFITRKRQEAANATDWTDKLFKKIVVYFGGGFAVFFGILLLLFIYMVVGSNRNMAACDALSVEACSIFVAQSTTDQQLDEVLLKRAKAYMAKGDMAHAHEDYSKILLNAPQNPEALTGLVKTAPQNHH